MIAKFSANLAGPVVRGWEHIAGGRAHGPGRMKRALEVSKPARPAAPFSLFH